MNRNSWRAQQLHRNRNLRAVANGKPRRPSAEVPSRRGVPRGGIGQDEVDGEESVIECVMQCSVGKMCPTNRLLEI